MWKTPRCQAQAAVCGKEDTSCACLLQRRLWRRSQFRGAGAAVQPFAQRAQTVRHGCARVPAKRARNGARVGDVPGLVTGPPFGEAAVRPLTPQFADQIDHLAQADSVRWAAAKVEDLAAHLVDSVEHADPGIYCILDKKRISDL